MGSYGAGEDKYKILEDKFHGIFWEMPFYILEKNLRQAGSALGAENTIYDARKLSK